jgi:hypothetical protein
VIIGLACFLIGIMAAALVVQLVPWTTPHAVPPLPAAVVRRRIGGLLCRVSSKEVFFTFASGAWLAGHQGRAAFRHRALPPSPDIPAPSATVDIQPLAAMSALPLKADIRSGILAMAAKALEQRISGGNV